MRGLRLFCAVNGGRLIVDDNANAEAVTVNADGFMSVTSGGTQTLGGRDYTLTLTDGGTLGVTLAGAAAPAVDLTGDLSRSKPPVRTNSLHFFANTGANLNAVAE